MINHSMDDWGWTRQPQEAEGGIQEATWKWKNKASFKGLPNETITPASHSLDPS